MESFRNMKLSSRLLVVVAIFVAGFAAFGLMSFRTANKIRVSGPVYEKVIESKDLVADVMPPPAFIIESFLISHQLVDETNPVVVEHLVERGRKLRREYDERHEHWMRTLADGKLRQTLNRAHQAALAFFEARDSQLVPAVLTGDKEKATQAQTVLRRHYDVHRAAIDEVVVLAVQASTTHERDAAETLEEDSRTLTLFGLGVVLLVVFLTFAAAKTAESLTERIELASGAATRIASGDLTVQLPHAGSDETGRLIASVKTMTESLNSLVNRVKQSSIEIMSTATEIAATSRQQQETVASFGTSTTEIAAATKEISATSQELLTTMEGVNEVAGRTSQVAEHGRTGIAGMDAMMRHLASSTTSISSKLSVIQEKAASINLAVTTITKVADQTNLLSVNAAIEAEKAGEYGLGFLVLAREIRRLADQTAVATLDIDRIVRQMQAAVTAGVMEMDKFSEEVRSGVKASSEIASQLGEIIAQVHTLSERFDAVNEGMRSQSSGAKQISDAMGQLTEGARQTSQSVQEWSGSAEHLRRAVGALKDEISRFTVTGD